jgi:hypothetical protein
LRADNHAGCAKSALQTMIVTKGFLHGIEFVTICQTFDSRYIGAIYLYGKQSAAFQRTAVDMDHAGTALTGITTHMGAGVLQVFA